jgi:FkbM family methyltransferase
MLNSIKKIFYKILPESAFLQLHHFGFYLLYNLGFLKGKKSFKYHYGVKSWIQPTDHVVDIGANLGYFAKTFAKLTPSGSLTCIEPIPAFYGILKRNLSRFPQVQILHTALGKENGSVTMVLPKSNGMVRTGLPHVQRENEKTEDAVKTEVKITSTKELFAGFKKIDYIKCDIEGYEWVVFQELKDVLAEHQPTVQIEISSENEVNLSHLFQELGYVQYGVCNFELVKDQIPQKEEGDFLFIHSSKVQDFLKKVKK